MPQLPGPYVSLLLPDGRCTYGGSQLKSPDPEFRRFGCGVIAALDLLLILSRGRYPRPELLPDRDLSIPLPDYFRSVDLLRRYLPILPKLGLPSPALGPGLNLVFRKYKLPYHARWFVPGSRLWTVVDEMLAAGIPVIMSAGKSFPNLLDRSGVPFYTIPDAVPKHSAGLVRAHYFVITGADAEWLTVSSWGQRYYLRKADYTAFAKLHTGSFLSSILLVRRV